MYNNHVILRSEMSKSVAGVCDGREPVVGPVSPLSYVAWRETAWASKYRAHMGHCSVQGPNKEGLRHKLYTLLEPLSDNKNIDS